MHVLVLLLLLVLGKPAEGLHHGLECDDQARAVCLAKGYSTFDLPLRTNPNLIKIGIINIRSVSYRLFRVKVLSYINFRV